MEHSRDGEKGSGREGAAKILPFLRVLQDTPFTCWIIKPILTILGDVMFGVSAPSLGGRWFEPRPSNTKRL